MRIQDVQVGWPAKIGTELMVRVMPFETDATSCGLYYEVKSDDGEMLANGNLQLTEEEFIDWGMDNTYIEDLALSKLGLSRSVLED